MTHPIPGADSERTHAEQEYMRLAFDYAQQPIGSRDWCLFWDGYRTARAAAKVGANVAADLPIDLKWDDKVKGYVSQPFTLSDLAAVAPTDDTITITRAELVTYRNQAFAEGAIEGRDQSIAAGAPAETPPDTCAEMRALCQYCGGTGDVHSIDGEWHGRCTCAAAQPAPAPIAGDVEKDAMALVNVATGVMDRYGILEGMHEEVIQEFCESLDAAFSKSLAALLANSSSGEAG